MNVTVLGGGMVGSAIVRDLSSDPAFSVTVADRDRSALDRCAAAATAVKTLQADLADPDALGGVIAEADLVIGAVPGFMGFETLRRVIDAGKNVVDISFFPEDPFTLDTLARERGVTAVMDCGLAPGLGNILMGRLNEELDDIDTFLCYVGGLPVVRRKPYEYAAVFSPIDVIEEYTRPARYIENGSEVVRPALSDIEEMDFDGIGTLEAFNTDGLRSLAVTMHAPNMKEKTMRYPGHVALMKALRDTGFFDKEAIDIAGQRIAPLDFTARLLFPAWEMKEGEEDLSVMRVIIEGRRGATVQRHTFDLLDRYDRVTGVTSMARTTGYTCAVAARLVADGSYRHAGISPPEFLGARADVYNALMAGLAARGIAFTHHMEETTKTPGHEE
ncbi:MAG: saccharopine dehydrogenase NADP-binding domain-containing protein [Bacteroidetes bacterium]|nr:saccharopine dehydrogenase NADP-binding domain-containing protein [Bacteroidota bacterium]